LFAKEFVMHIKPLVRSALFISIIGGLSMSAQAADWLQFGYDQAHSGYNAQETGYPVASASTARWSVSIHAKGSGTTISSNAAPVFLSDVVTSAGTKDVVYVVTNNGTLVAFAADTGTVLWSQQPSTNQVHEGTTGSPAIDPNKQFVYAYAHDGFVHKYKVGDGTEITGGGWPELSTKKTDAEKGAAAIAFSTPTGGVNYLYHVTNGYGGDGGDYQGHITAINLTTGAQNVFNVMCSNLLNIHFVEDGTPRVDDCNLNPPPNRDGQMAGIWGRPGTIYDAATNRIYIASANGLFDANITGDHEWGDSVLALHPDGTGSGMGMPVDSYTPSNYGALYGGDTDLGSTAPAILPAGTHHLAIQSGKDSCVRLIDLDDMSGQGGPGHAGGEINAAKSCDTGGDAIGGGVVFPQPAVWVNPADQSTWAYVSNDSKIVAYKLDVSGATPSLSKQWTGSGGTSAVISNGTLFYVSGSGALRGLNAVSGSQVWSATVGGIKWQSPIVVNGHIYVTDNNGKLWSFALDGIFAAKFD
jgi:outer membrane protein assembly factor BamB